MVSIASKRGRLRHKVAAAVEPLRLCGGFHCDVETSRGCSCGHAMIPEESRSYRHISRSPPLIHRTGRVLASMVATTSSQRYDPHRCHTTVNTPLFSRPLRILTSPSRHSLSRVVEAAMHVFRKTAKPRQFRGGFCCRSSTMMQSPPRLRRRPRPVAGSAPRHRRRRIRKL